MDELLELLARIGTDNPPTDEELATAREELLALLQEATAKETRDLDAAAGIREGIDQIDAEVKAREEAETAADEQAAKLLEGLTEDDAEDDDDTEDDEDEVVDEAPVPVAASRTRTAAAIRKTRARMDKRAESTKPSSRGTLLTLGAAQSESIRPDGGVADVAQVFARATTRVKGSGARDTLVRLEWDFPDERRLFGSERTENDSLLDSVMAPAAIAAAGGICDPLPADFSHPFLGRRGRPIRDRLPRFQAARGGVRFSPMATIGDVTAGVGVWTHATDTSPGDAQKNLLVLECEEEAVAHVDAITASLQIGNFQAKFNPEFWRSRLDLLMVAHDRLAEQTLYANLDANSVQVTYGAGNGTIYSVLSAVDKAAAGLRSRLRLLDHPIVAIFPEWVKTALRSDIASQRLGSSPADALTVADQVINSFFAARGVTPVWSPDIDLFGAQNAGALLDFPGGNAEFIIYPEGAHFFLDGGILDLGTEIIDGDSVRKNNRIAFQETFEKGVFRGGQSLAVTVPIDELCVCPDVVDLTSA